MSLLLSCNTFKSALDLNLFWFILIFANCWCVFEYWFSFNWDTFEKSSCNLIWFDFVGGNSSSFFMDSLFGKLIVFSNSGSISLFNISCWLWNSSVLVKLFSFFIWLSNPVVLFSFLLLFDSSPFKFFSCLIWLVLNLMWWSSLIFVIKLISPVLTNGKI